MFGGDTPGMVAWSSLGTWAALLALVWLLTVAVGVGLLYGVAWIVGRVRG